MTFNLDLKDRKLLHQLDANARQSNSGIAKKIGLSPEVVNYRIKRLEQENIITQYQLIVNLMKLNILQFKICLRFQHIKSQALNAIIEELKKNIAVKWIVSCKGSWDMIISLETDSLENVSKLKNEILALFENYLDDKSISILVEAQTFNRDYLIEDKSLMTKGRVIMKQDTPIVLDELDVRLLKKLSENARKSVVELAAELKTTVRIATYRVRQLEKNKVILGYKIALNYDKLGIKFYKTFLYLDNPKTERVKSLVNYLENNKNLIHNVKVLGNWDFEPEFEVDSEADFNTILQDLKDNFSDIIKKVDVITISKEHKFVYF